MIVAGITGGIGSGKTTICKTWEKLGAKIIYADELAKKLMVNDKELRKKLISAFGKETYKADGKLNKTHLIKEAFEKNRVEELNQIVHPAVAHKFSDICDDERKFGTRLIVKEAALLLNYGRPADIEIVVLVLSEKKNQIERVKQRDNSTADDIEARMQKQPDFNKLTHMADYIIHNDGSLEELQEKAKDLYTKILQS